MASGPKPPDAIAVFQMIASKQLPMPMFMLLLDASMHPVDFLGDTERRRY